jgi:hypothetical protein
MRFATAILAGFVLAIFLPAVLFAQPLPESIADGSYALADSPAGGAAPQPAAEQAPAAAAVEEEAEEEEEKEWRLFDGPRLAEKRIEIRGWLEQGYTVNFQDPANRFNGPVGYNDRSNEYQMNQLYLIGERVTKTDECNLWDVGGRVDLLYGTDHRFNQVTVGTGWDDDFASGRFYGLSIPQFYGDVALGKLVFRGGHFLYPCGAESIMAPDNFFYSHTYMFLYGQPTTFTGGMLRYNFNDKLAAIGGIDTGWNNFEPANDKLGYFTGFNWTIDEKTSVNFVLTLGNQQPEGVESNRTHLCAVLNRKLGEKWTYMLETNYGSDSVSAVTGGDADFWSFGNYLYYQINECWSAGARWEYFNDQDGIVVIPPSAPFPGAPAIWQDLSLGLNYKPNKNVIVRSEIRYDWEKPLAANTVRPFDDNTRSSQWLWGTDLILKF